jgi:hypothetical protein
VKKERRGLGNGGFNEALGWQKKREEGGLMAQHIGMDQPTLKSRMA